MIVGTSHSPAQAFITFAREFFECLAKNEYGLALEKLDASSKRWNKHTLRRSLSNAVGSAQITSAKGITQSAKPVVDDLQNGEYTLTHRLPIEGKWGNVYVVFRFRQKLGTSYFHVDLVAIDQAAL